MRGCVPTCGRRNVDPRADRRTSAVLAPDGIRRAPAPQRQTPLGRDAALPPAPHRTVPGRPCRPPCEIGFRPAWNLPCECAAVARSETIEVARTGSYLLRGRAQDAG